MSKKCAAKTFTVYYDGKCPICAATMGAVAQSSKKDQFALRDMHCEKSLPFNWDAIDKEIHLVDASGYTFKGADAMLKIAEQYPHLRMLVALGAAAPIRPLLPFGYRFVAANRRFLAGEASRVFWVKAAVTLAFVFGLLLSTPLWIGPRSYPPAPISDLLPSTTALADKFLFAALLASAAIILASARPQKFIVVFLGAIGVLCALDQTRWQPWVFQYSFLMVALALFSWDSDDARGRARTLNIARLIIASTYLFSGLQKINGNFVQYEFPWLVQPLTDLVPASASTMWWLGCAAPFIQVGFALGLLTRRFRRISLYLAIAMHVFILAMFGPLGHNWNIIIWPWTAAMAVLDVLLFAGKDDFSPRDIIWMQKRCMARGDARAVRDAAVVEFLQSLGLLPVFCALRRQHDASSDLHHGCREERSTGARCALLCAYVTRYERTEYPALGHRRPQRDTLSGNARVQGDR